MQEDLFEFWRACYPNAEGSFGWVGDALVEGLLNRVISSPPWGEFNHLSRDEIETAAREFVRLGTLAG